MATLYIVSTPIGNLGDVTYRAIDVLSRVHRILAEDTRRTSVLCRRYEVATPRVSAHAHNEESRVAAVIEWLDGGHDLALVSDAGTPLLSDPGARIVRAAIAAGHEVVPVPGASAMLAALVAAGLTVEPFTFYGFLPRSGGERTRVLEAVSRSPHTTVLYEAPGRLRRLLRDLASACGGGRAVAVGRELTKLHEDIFRGTLDEALAYYGDTPIRGEVAVVVAGSAGPAPESPIDASRLIRELVASGQTPSAAAREAARRFGIPRNEAYRLAIEPTTRED